MITFRPEDGFTDKANVQEAIDYAENLDLQHSKTVNTPAPIHSYKIKAVLSGEEWEWNPLTVQEEEAQKWQDFQNARAQEMLNAETTPSPKYAEFRRLEYPDPRDYLDAKVKQNSSYTAIQAEGVAQEQAYLDACMAVKTKYPKP